MKHPLKAVVGIVFFAVLAGNDEWAEIADFAVDEKDTLQRYLELPNGIPSHDTIQRVFFILRPDGLQNMLVTILVQLVSVALGNVTVNVSSVTSLYLLRPAGL